MTKPLRLLLHGVTGRMGQARHLEGALLPLSSSEFDLEITLAGRGSEKLTALGKIHNFPVETKIQDALHNQEFDLLFDASNPVARYPVLKKALSKSIGVYTEKPIALELRVANELYELATKHQVFNGIVQDKLFTQGFRAAKKALEEELVGNVFDIRCEFGYWVETGLDGCPINRPSWNFQTSLGGSLIPDLFSHWNYIIEMVDQVAKVSASTKTHVRERADENGNTFRVTIPDIAHVIFETKTGITGTITSSWIQRPLVPFTVRIFGSLGSITFTPILCLFSDGHQEQDLISKFEIAPEDEFLLQWRAVLQSLVSKTNIEFTFESALRQAELCSAIEKSASEGRTISVERYTNWVHSNFPLMG